MSFIPSIPWWNFQIPTTPEGWDELTEEVIKNPEYKFPMTARQAQGCYEIELFRRLLARGLISKPDPFIGLSERVLNCIDSANIETVEELKEAILSHTALKWRRFGRQSYHEVIEWLKLDIQQDVKNEMEIARLKANANYHKSKWKKACKKIALLEMFQASQAKTISTEVPKP